MLAILLFSIFILLSSYSQSFSAVNISTFVNNSTSMKLNGSDFGTTGPSIEWTGDNIESGTIDSYFSKSGWVVGAKTSANIPPEYTASLSHSGNKSLKCDLSNVNGTEYDSTFTWSAGSDLFEYYISFWVRFDAVSGTTGQWKSLRPQRGTSVSDSEMAPGQLFSNWYKTDGSGLMVYLGALCGPWNSLYGESNGCTNWGDVGYLDETKTFLGNQIWKRVELWIKHNSVRGAVDGSVQFTIHSPLAINVVKNANNIETRTEDLDTSYETRYICFENFRC